MPWAWVVNRGNTSTLLNGTGGIPLLIEPVARPAETNSFRDAVAPTEGHPNCRELCMTMASEPPASKSRTDACSSCICNHTGVVALTSSQQWLVRIGKLKIQGGADREYMDT